MSGRLNHLVGVASRLQNQDIQLRADDARQLIRDTDGPDTFFYCDPPYLAETRTDPDAYEYEYSETDHAASLRRFKTSSAKPLSRGMQVTFMPKSMRLGAGIRSHIMNRNCPQVMGRPKPSVSG